VSINQQEAMITSRDEREKSSIMMCKKQDLYFPTKKEKQQKTK
jgi:hypothetical protein